MDYLYFMKRTNKIVKTKKLVLSRQELRDLTPVVGGGDKPKLFTETITTIFSQVVSCV